MGKRKPVAKVPLVLQAPATGATPPAAAPQPIVTVIRQGDTTKPDPFTICIIANPALESPFNSRTFTVDPIVSDQPGFDAAVGYIHDALFGALPGQMEKFIDDPSVASSIRVVSIFVAGLAAADPNSLVAQDGVSNLLIARRSVFTSFLSRHGLHADIGYAVSGSPDHTRASAWYTSDDDSRPGVPFTLDGVSMVHRFYSLIPGTIALPVSSTSLTALHEFGHALSSYSNGSVTDLYVDSDVAVNVKRGRPIPPNFGTYNAGSFASDATRDGLGYPASWQSYHCELIDPTLPAVMDNYWQAPSGKPEQCQHDKMTRRFLLDRLRAKIAR